MSPEQWALIISLTLNVVFTAHLMTGYRHATKLNHQLRTRNGIFAANVQKIPKHVFTTKKAKE